MLPPCGTIRQTTLITSATWTFFSLMQPTAVTVESLRHKHPRKYAKIIQTPSNVKPVHTAPKIKAANISALNEPSMFQYAAAAETTSAAAKNTVPTTPTIK